jgi:hypothetical protein
MDFRAWIPRLSSGTDPGDLPLGPDDKAVLAVVDGLRTIAEVLRDTVLPAPRALGSLAKLHDLAALETAPVEVAAALAAFRQRAGVTMPRPVPLDPPEPHTDADALLPPPPWESAGFDRRPSAFSAVPTETELPTVGAPVAAAAAPVTTAPATHFEESDPTLVEEEDDVLPVPAERTMVDARVLPPETEDEDWGEEPGTLQDPKAPGGEG